MNIKEAAKRTGLTKKAIKYYEGEGLIQPKKNPENNYREYSQEDLTRLNLIAAMRMLEIPVEEIRRVIQQGKSLTQVARDFKQVVDQKVKTLENSRLILSELIEGEVEDPSAFQHRVVRLKEALEMSPEQRQQYVSKRLEQIFPGGFGALLVRVNHPFFNFTIETKAQEETWLAFVEYLDSFEDPDPNHPFLQMFRASEAAMAQYLRNQEQEVRALLEGDREKRREIRRGIREFMLAFEEQEGFQERYQENLDKSRDLFATMEDREGEFSRFMEELNEDYRRYNEIYQGIVKEVEAEIGLSMEDLINPRES